MSHFIIGFTSLAQRLCTWEGSTSFPGVLDHEAPSLQEACFRTRALLAAPSAGRPCVWFVPITPWDCTVEWTGRLVLVQMKQKLEISSGYWRVANNKCWALSCCKLLVFWEVHPQNVLRLTQDFSSYISIRLCPHAHCDVLFSWEGR